ncbi:MAG TPA: glycoside hydrolase family 3 N-terminal domain-containing protein [Terriglobales bacterium]|nr:glycoside hydrolase family 3 N-terminal domain-containing protein [Terriglobales bacterium]
MTQSITRRTFLLLIAALFAISAFAKTKYQPLPVRLDHDGEKWAEKTLHKMSTEEKVGQLFMIWTRAEFLNADSAAYLQLRDNMNKYHVGSFAMTVPYEPPFLYKSGPYEAAELLNRLQTDSKLPLLIAADFELGVSNRLRGATGFPNAMAIGASGQTKYAEDFGRITAEEARAIGVHWNFFPVADVNSNPDNPIINTRSFGEDPQQVADFVAAYIRGAHSAGMLVTAKHFPGHGDTATDSHLGTAQVTGNRARLDAVELPPFRKAIESGVDAIMIAHVTVPALDPNPNAVASVSPTIVTGLLKQQLHFQGLVITDALDMGALTRLYSANLGQEAVDAFKAGNDVLLIPPDLDVAYRGVLAAVRSGEISESRLDESVLKILKTKASLGLQKARLVDISALDKTVGTPEHIADGQQIADAGVTLVRQNHAVLPLKKIGTNAAGLPYQAGVEVRNRLVVMIFSDDVRLEAGRMLERQIKSRAPDANVIYTDPNLASAVTPGILSAVQQAERVVVAVYATPTAGKVVATNGGARNSVALPDPSADLLHRILSAKGQKTIVLAVGNPYLARDFPEVQNYLCTFSAAPVSEVSAVKALFGEMEIHGRLPVTIPGIAARGAGTTELAKRMARR